MSDPLSVNTALTADMLRTAWDAVSSLVSPRPRFILGGPFVGPYECKTGHAGDVRFVLIGEYALRELIRRFPRTALDNSLSIPFDVQARIAGLGGIPIEPWDGPEHWPLVAAALCPTEGA